jgi:hypothetical protein
VSKAKQSFLEATGYLGPLYAVSCATGAGIDLLLRDVYQTLCAIPKEHSPEELLSAPGPRFNVDLPLY